MSFATNSKSILPLTQKVRLIPTLVVIWYVFTHSQCCIIGMGVDMALNVGGPACRVLYSPSRGNDLSPNEGRNPRMLKLHSRAQNSSNLLNEKWDEELGSQLEPALKRSDSEDRFVLPTHVALPRLLQLASEPFSNGLKTSRRASFFSTGTYSHRILRRKFHHNLCPDSFDFCLT